MVEIYDCRKAEKLVISKVRGDLQLQFIDVQTGQVLYSAWFQIKIPWMRRYHTIVELFEEIKENLERQ